MLPTQTPTRSRTLARTRRMRGASVVEYAMLVIGVMFIAAGAWRVLGTGVKKSSGKSAQEIGEQGNGSNNGGGQQSANGGGGGGGGGGAGGGGGGGKMGATSKVNVGGVGGGAGGGGGGGQGSDSTSANGGDGTFATSSDEAPADVTDIKFKRGLGIGFLTAGVLAIGYVIAKARNMKSEAAAQGGNGPADGPPVPPPDV